MPLEYEVENELVIEILAVIVISFHRWLHRIAAGYLLAICLQFHHVWVNLQLTDSNLVPLIWHDLVSRESKNWIRFVCFQSCGLH